jgi:uncharacterized membrane protein YphA (DoxX/SURF4 family)
MKKTMHINGSVVLVTITQFLLVLLFVYTGISKWIAHDKFKGVLSKSPWVNNWAAVIAYLLPAIEILIAILLVIPTTIEVGLKLALVLLVLLTCYLGAMLVFAPQLPCACGGVIESLGWKSHILFNLVFVGLTMAAIRYYQQGRSRKPATE